MTHSIFDIDICSENWIVFLRTGLLFFVHARSRVVWSLSLLVVTVTLSSTLTNFYITENLQ